MDQSPDPGLQTLFARAAEHPPPAPEAFTAAVMAQVKAQQRWRAAPRMLGWFAGALALWWLDGLVSEAAMAATGPLLPLEGLVAQLVAPLNSLAGALAVLALAVRAIVRRGRI